MRWSWLALLSGCFITQGDVDPDGDGFCPPGWENVGDCGPDADCDNSDASIKEAQSYHEDADGDGYGDPAVTRRSCDPDADGLVDDATDCNDAAADEHPGASWYADGDGDGYGAGNATACRSAASDVAVGGDCDDADPYNWSSCGSCVDTDGDGAWVGCDAYDASHAEDCDDTDATIYPGAPELCDGLANACGALPLDEIDNDLDRYVECSGWLGSPVDVDGGSDCNDADEHNWTMCATCVDGDGDGDFTGCDAYSLAQEFDCDDADASENAAVTWYADSDADGYGDPAVSSPGCRGAANDVTNPTDCDDTDATENPTVTWYDDGDGDGYGDPASPNVCERGAPTDVVDATDCDDSDPDNWAGCGSCVDADTDGAYVGCDAFAQHTPDCDDADPDNWASCGTCVDTDLDGAFVGCDAYVTDPADCDDTNPNASSTCATCVDTDGDGWFGLCDGYVGIDGPDCDEADVDNWAAPCSCVDADGDNAYVGCDAYTTRTADCDDTDINQSSVCGTCVDLDGDGAFVGCDDYTGIDGPDCDDNDASERPAVTWYADADGDGYGDSGPGTACQRGAPSDVTNSNDCSDADPDVWSSCASCVDLDGDGAYRFCDAYVADPEDCDDLDENVWTPAACAACGDVDGDGWWDACDAYTTVSGPDCADDDVDNWLSCATCVDADFDGAWSGCDAYTAVTQDCDDSDSGEYPGVTWYADADGDSYGNAAVSSSCERGAGTDVLDATDCDDTDVTEFPGQVWHADADADGYGDPGVTSACQRGALPGATLEGTDCDDGDVDNWAAPCACVDADGDGAFAGCDAYTTRSADCDDGDPTVSSSCGTCVDLDGDGAFVGCDAYVGIDGPDCDDGDPTERPAVTWYADADGDGYGDASAATVCERAAPTDVTDATDCADTDADVWMSCGTCMDGDGDGAFTGCDAYVVDPLDCDDGMSQAWTTCATCQDADGDGWYELCDDYAGVLGPDCADDDLDNWLSCATCVDADFDGAWVGCDAYTAVDEDCDDGDGTVLPGAAELCDGLDNDCNLALPAVEVDADSDDWVVCTVDAGGWDGTPTVVGGGDCADADPTRNPGEAELCDGIDNDCVGGVDNGTPLTTWYPDGDGDGYGDPLASVDQCGQPGGYLAVGGDCDDSSPDVWSSCATCEDLDGDGWWVGCDAYATVLGEDCDDGEALAWPGAEELCDGVDNDCSGSVDLDEVLFYEDFNARAVGERVTDFGWVRDPANSYWEVRGDVIDEGNSIQAVAGPGGYHVATHALPPYTLGAGDRLEARAVVRLSPTWSGNQTVGLFLSEDYAPGNPYFPSVHVARSGTLVSSGWRDGVTVDAAGIPLTNDTVELRVQVDGAGIVYGSWRSPGLGSWNLVNTNAGSTAVPNEVMVNSEGAGWWVDSIVVSVVHTGLDTDGDGSSCLDDCDESNPAIHPGEPETIGDGVDSNCDGYDGCEDLNCDGRPDLVLPGGSQVPSSTLVVYSPDRLGGSPPASFAEQNVNASVVEDFDRDGFQDLALAVYGPAGPGDNADSVVYWGSPTGPSAATKTLLPTLKSSVPCGGDVDGDGWPDVIITGGEGANGSPTLSESYIFWSNGDRTFTAQYLGDDHDHVEACLVDDLDGDGDLDLVIVSSASNSHVGWNTGTRAFTWDSLDVTGMFGIAAARVDADPYKELLLIDGSGSGDDRVFWGPGVHGDYRPADSVLLDSTASYQGAFGDVNLDGLVDIVVSTRSGTSPSLMYLGRSGGTHGVTWGPSADGSFDAPQAATMRLTDLDRDGNPDVVFPNVGASPTLSLHFGLGDGTFASFDGLSDATRIPFYSGFLVVADLNLDGWNDIVQPEYVTTHLMWGSVAGWSTGDQLDVVGTNAVYSPKAVAAHDADGDGWPTEGPGAVDCDDTTNLVHPLRPEVTDGRDNDCSGLVDDIVDDDLDTVPDHLDACPGFDDLLDTDLSGVADGCDQDGDGHHVDEDCDDTDPTIHPAALEVIGDGTDANCDGYDGCEDLNCDGRPDLVLPGYSATVPAVTRVLYGVERGALGPTATFSENNATYSAVADLDRDGFQDLVLTVSGQGGPGDNADSVVYWGSPSGPSVATQTRLGTVKAGIVVVGDLDGDGWKDLVIGAGEGANGSSTTAESFVFWNDGDRTFTAQDLGSQHDGVNDLLVDDLDGDGDLDLVVVSFYDGDYDVLSNIGWNTGPRAFTWDTVQTHGGRSVKAARVDGDAFKELLFVNATGDDQLFWGPGVHGDFRDADSVVLDSWYTTDASFWDVNHDGLIDIVAASSWLTAADSSRVFLGRPGGSHGITWGPAADTLLDAPSANALALTDLDRDGNADVVFPNYNGSPLEGTIHFGVGDGTFTSFDGLTDANAIAYQGGQHVAVADLNLDGFNDVVLTVARDNAPDGTFTSHVLWGSASGWSLGDKLDVVSGDHHHTPLVVAGHDADGDGWPSEGAGLIDCDDSTNLVHPNRPEVTDGRDSDCNGLVDDIADLDFDTIPDHLDVCAGFDDRLDADGDGVPDACDLGVDLDGDGHDNFVDCNDADANVFPGAPELCDGVANDCATAGSWTLADEAGVVTAFDAGGVPTDATATFAAGTPGAPVPISVTDATTYQLCPGTFYVSIDVLGVVAEFDGMGADPTEVVLSGGDAVRVMMAQTGTSLTVRGLTLTDGNASWGGALGASEADVTLEDVIISSSYATEGGGLRLTNGTTGLLTRVDCSSTAFGGGCAEFDSGAVVVIEDSTLTGSAVDSGGALVVANSGTDVTLIDTLVNGATVSTSFGGGAYVTNGGTLRCEGQVGLPGGFQSNSPNAVYLNSSSWLFSNACDWTGNQVSAGGVAFNYGADATFSCFGLTCN